MKNIEDLLKEIDTLLEYATPAPWYVVDDGRNAVIATISEDELKYRKMRSKIEKEIEKDNNIVLRKHTFPMTDKDIVVCCDDNDLVCREDDLILMARSRSILPVLVDEIRRLQSENKILEERFREVDNECDSFLSLLLESTYPNIVK